ncbi:MAG: DUF4143 domain-containing protein [Opitutales bacterium]
MIRHPLRGAFFENMVIVDLLKNRLNSGRDGRLLFYRDSNGREIDLLYPVEQMLAFWRRIECVCSTR